MLIKPSVTTDPEPAPNLLGRKIMRWVIITVFVVILAGVLLTRAWEAWGPIAGLPSSRATKLQGPSFTERLELGDVTEEEFRDFYADLGSVALKISPHDSNINLSIEGHDDGSHFSLDDEPSIKTHIKSHEFYLDGQLLDMNRGRSSTGSEETALSSYGVSIYWKEIKGRDKITIRVAGATELRTEDERLSGIFNRFENHFPFDLSQTIDVATLREQIE